MTQYAYGVALIYGDDTNLKEILPLTMLNPAPPPPGGIPPPPAFGSITGSVTKSGQDFALSIDLGQLSPDRVNQAYFTSDGALLDYTSVPFTKSPMTWTPRLQADFVPFASYIEVVAVKYGVASSNYLTLHW